MYTEKELVAVAKRENNPKRAYLVVNKLQGKHIPVSPVAAFCMFRELADMVGQRYPGEKLLLVGFAETATAIGAFLSVCLDTWYMQTTRENIPGVEYLYFSESHSHAVEQKLVKTDLDKVIGTIDRIVFVEDEVTTGNTILHIIERIQEAYEAPVKFGVASLLNGMDEASRQNYREREIDTLYLVKTDHAAYTGIAQGYRGDGAYYSFGRQVSCSTGNPAGYMEASAGEAAELHGEWAEEMESDKIRQTAGVQICQVSGCMNARRLLRGAEYGEACESLWQKIREKAGITDGQRVLIVGTEEFMYPALYVGSRLEECGNRVKSHSTTRSPIAVSTEAEYPLHERYELVSLYDNERTTYLYDIDRYDKVIVVTDAKMEMETEAEQSGEVQSVEEQPEAVQSGKVQSVEEQPEAVQSGKVQSVEEQPDTVQSDKLRHGLCSLLRALQSKGNDDISVFVWKDSPVV